MDKKCSFEESMVIWDVFIELDVSSAYSYHDVVSAHLDDLFLGTNKVDHTFNVNNWNCQVQLSNQSLNLFFQSEIVSFFNNERNWC